MWLSSFTAPAVEKTIFPPLVLPWFLCQTPEDSDYGRSSSGHCSVPWSVPFAAGMNHAALNISVQSSVWSHVFSSFGYVPRRTALCSHTVALCLTISETARLSPKVASPF